RRFLRLASVAEPAQTVVGFETARNRSRLRLARQHALALRRAGLHGIGNTRPEGDARWLVESLSAKQKRRAELAVPRRIIHAADAACVARPRRSSRDVEPVELRDS